jgi:hypothetical protein
LLQLIETSNSCYLQETRNPDYEYMLEYLKPVFEYTECIGGLTTTNISSKYLYPSNAANSPVPPDSDKKSFVRASCTTSLIDC